MKTSTKNTNKVPKRQWGKWSSVAKAVFNRTYGFIFHNQWSMCHAKAPRMSPLQWKELAWNAAWIAADAVDDAIPNEIANV